MDALRIECLQLSADVRLEVSAYPGALELRLLRRTPDQTFGPTAAGFRCPALFAPHLAEILTELTAVATVPSEPGVSRG